MDLQETLKDLMEKIPGYTGYREMEDRRDADYKLRTHLAGEYKAERRKLVQLSQKVVDAKRFDVITKVDEVLQQLDRFISRLETAPRGYSPWFSAQKIDPATLDQLYDFDAKLAEGLAGLRERLGFALTELNPEGKFAEALDALLDFVQELQSQFDARQNFLAMGKMG